MSQLTEVPIGEIPHNSVWQLWRSKSPAGKIARAMVMRDGVAVFIAPGGIPIWFDHEGVASIVGDTAAAV